MPIELEPAATTRPKPPRRSRSAAAATPAIEIEVAGLLVRVPPGMDTETIAAVLQAAKALR